MAPPMPAATMRQSETRAMPAGDAALRAAWRLRALTPATSGAPKAAAGADSAAC
ncbi:MAG: hypothetical protein ACE5GW_03050 [Planctomycetota bacterium]